MAEPPKPTQSKSAPAPGRDANPGGMKPVNPAGVGKGKAAPRGPPKPKPPAGEKKKMRILDKGFKDDEPEGWDDEDDEDEEDEDEEDEDLEEHVEPIYESISADIIREVVREEYIDECADVVYERLEKLALPAECLEVARDVLIDEISPVIFERLNIQALLELLQPEAREEIVEATAEVIFERLLAVEIEDVLREEVGESRALLDQLVIEIFEELMAEILREEVLECVIDEHVPILYEKIIAQVLPQAIQDEARDAVVDELSEAIFTRLLLVEVDDVCHEVIGEDRALVDQLVDELFEDLLRESVRQEVRDFIVDESIPIVYEKIAALIMSQEIQNTARDALSEELSEAIFERLLAPDIEEVCREEVSANRAQVDLLASDVFEQLVEEVAQEVSEHAVAVFTVIAEITGRHVDSDMSAVLLVETELIAEETLEWARVVEGCAKPAFDELLRRLISAECEEAFRELMAENLSRKTLEEALRAFDESNKAQNRREKLADIQRRLAEAKERRKRREAEMNEKDVEMAALIEALDRRADQRIAAHTGRLLPTSAAPSGPGKRPDPRAEHAEAQVDSLVERGLNSWVDDWLHDRMPSPELRRRMRQVLDEVTAAKKLEKHNASDVILEDYEENNEEKMQISETAKGKEPPRPILKKKVSFSA